MYAFTICLIIFLTEDLLSVIATVPRLAFVTQSCTNVAKMDDRFTPSYAVKYSAGHDEKLLIHLKGKDAQHLEVHEGRIQNLKISGQRIISSAIASHTEGEL